MSFVIHFVPRIFGHERSSTFAIRTRPFVRASNLHIGAAQRRHRSAKSSSEITA